MRMQDNISKKKIDNEFINFIILPVVMKLY